MFKGKRFYGLHFSEGIATFSNIEGNGFVSLDEAIKMNETMSGVPIFVTHDEDSDVIGIVVKSFYNKNDGKIWCEFILFDNEAIKLVEAGWTLSNAYDFTVKEKEGHYHGIDYDFEVIDGIYRHLAIVEDPRYSESKILTPEEFDSYNKELERQTAINSKEEVKKMSFLKSVKARMTKNEKDQAEKAQSKNALMQTKVTLPKTGREVTINELIEEVDARDFEGYEASLKDYVHIDGVKITFEDALKKIEEFAPGKSVVEIFTEVAPETEVITENEDDKETEENEDKEDKEENQEEEVEEKNTSKNSRFEGLMSADRRPKTAGYTPSFKTISQRAENGRAKYGRGK